MYVNMKLAVLTVKFGWGPRSGIPFSNFATTYSHIFGEWGRAYEFGTSYPFYFISFYTYFANFARVGLALTEKYTPDTIQCYITTSLCYTHVLSWSPSQRESIQPLTKATSHLLRYGDRVFATIIYLICVITTTFNVRPMQGLPPFICMQIDIFVVRIYLLYFLI
jgi:hypothetical protein